MTRRADPPVEMLEKLSPCGAAKFLAAILEADEAKLRVKLGIPEARCPQCGKVVKRHQLFCSRRCRHQYSEIQVICDECGINFFRSKSMLLHQLKKHEQKHLFCNHKCKGAFLGRAYGFQIKWDHTQILALRKETGWGSRRLGRYLGIPQGTIEKVLQKQKASLRGDSRGNGWETPAPLNGGGFLRVKTRGKGGLNGKPGK